MARQRTSPRRAPRTARRRRGPRAALAVLAAALAAAVAGCSGGPIAASTTVSEGVSFVSGSYSSTYFPPGSRPAAPAVRGTTLTGRAFRLAAERGHVVVLNFWGSWCAPCRREAPVLAALARRLAPRGVRFVGVDIDDSVSSAEAFERDFNVGYPSLNDPGDQVALAFHGTLPPAAIPSTLVIDRSGRIAARVVGEVTYAGLRAVIARVLAERA